ncbi:MAG: dihydroorotase [Candidatus Omnitrophica bacterium]|nr:dihydroorotase [Candidatus Omnitrophota bacterium]
MGSKSILIKGGQVIDPSRDSSQVKDILIEDGVVKEVSNSISSSAEIVIEAKGKIVMPGLVDMHVHLREPGREDKETVLSGTQAALSGGVTSVLAMANTDPATDSVEHLAVLNKIIRQTAVADVFVAAAMTKAREGWEITDFSALRKRGAIAVSDDGSSVDDPVVMKKILKAAKKENLLVICHCEDISLSRGGSVNLGFTSTRLGLRGISRESEYQRVARDIELAKEIGARIHIAHVSCRESVEIIAKAKKEGVAVTAETAPHYFVLTDQATRSFDTNMKMNPPLRSAEDVESIRLGLSDGTIDVIASDHAPHTANEKDIEFDRAAFGVIGLETELAVAITELVHSGALSWLDLAKKLSYNPAKIIGIDKGTLRVGASADIIVVSPDQQWLVAKENFRSKSKNSCFLNKKLKGAVEYTIYRGQLVYQR